MSDDIRMADYVANGPHRAEKLVLLLYIAATAPNSRLAEANLRRLLAECGADYSLEVVDCMSDPLRALRDGILVTPTLVKASPFPQQIVIGTLGDPRRLATLLDLLPAVERSGTHD